MSIEPCFYSIYVSTRTNITFRLCASVLLYRYEKRGIALNVPRVDMDKCTQCNYCSLICPHAAVRPFLSTSKDLEAAPESFKKGSRKAIGGGALDNYNFRVQVFGQSRNIPAHV